MEGIYQHYIIDMSSNNNFVQVPTNQGDGNNIRGFEVELISNGVPYVIDSKDTVIAIAGTKPDTKEIFNDCTLTDEGYILVDITSQMSAVKGRGDYQIVLMSKSTNSQLKSFPFIILTTTSTFDVDYITSTDEFRLLTKNITQVETVISNANEAIEDIRELEDTVENSEKSRVSAENARVANENARKTAENTRITNENARKTEETVRVNAESDRTAAEEIRIQNENTRIANENARKTAETNRVNAETSRVNAEKERIAAETTRETNETTRKSNEESRKTAETNRVSAESARVIAENTRVTNENTRKTAEITRQTNETKRQTNTATAISNAEKATERANTAAETCEGIIDGTGLIPSSEKGAANGVATLDSNGKLISSQLTFQEVIADTEPNSQITGMFWLQPY